MIGAGATMFAAGAAWWALAAGLTPDYAGDMLGGMLLTGIGVGLTLPTFMATGASSLPPQSFATGSAVVNMLRQVGLAVGVAVLVAVLGTPSSPAGALAAYRHGWEMIAGVSLLAALSGIVLLRSPRRVAAGAGRHGRRGRRRPASSAKSGRLRPAVGHRRRLDDRGRRLAVGGEAVDDLLQVLDRAHVGGHHVAVVAGDPAAVDDLRASPCELGDAVQLARRRSHPENRGQRQPQRPRVDARVVAEDHPVPLQPLQALGDRRRGQPDAATQLRQAEPGVGLKLGDEQQIGVVQRSGPSILRHSQQSTFEDPCT